MHRLFGLALFYAFLNYGTATPFSDCGSQTGKVEFLEVSNCPDDQDVCVLKKGTQPEITMKFTSLGESKELKAYIHGIIVVVPIPFFIPDSDACKSGVSCPITNGESYTYSNKFDVKTTYPAIPVGVKYELRDDNELDVVCVVIPCRIE